MRQLEVQPAVSKARWQAKMAVHEFPFKLIAHRPNFQKRMPPNVVREPPSVVAGDFFANHDARRGWVYTYPRRRW